MLKCWLQHEYISGSSHSLNSLNAVLPRKYGLSNIHKVGYPLWVIVASGSPLNNLATFLHKILKQNLPIPFSRTNNIFKLTKKLSEILIPIDYSFISLDVISLFTNVPIDLAIEILEEKWEFIKHYTSLLETEFFSAIKLVLNSTFFSLNNKIYKHSELTWDFPFLQLLQMWCYRIWNRELLKIYLLNQLFMLGMLTILRLLHQKTICCSCREI